MLKSPTRLLIKNTTLSKFVTNVESRIFANLSKQMVDNMFGTNCTEDAGTEELECPLNGTATLPDGSVVSWEKSSTFQKTNSFRTYPITAPIITSK